MKEGQNQKEEGPKKENTTEGWNKAMVRKEKKEEKEKTKTKEKDEREEREENKEQKERRRVGAT